MLETHSKVREEKKREEREREEQRERERERERGLPRSTAMTGVADGQR